MYINNIILYNHNMVNKSLSGGSWCYFIVSASFVASLSGLAIFQILYSQASLKILLNVSFPVFKKLSFRIYSVFLLPLLSKNNRKKKKNETIVGRAVQSSTALYLIAPLFRALPYIPLFWNFAHLPEENPPYISAFKLVKMAVPTLPTLFQNQHLNRDYDQRSGNKEKHN